jgi:hypothetical protein
LAERFDVSIAKVGKLDKRNRLTVNATPTRAGIFTYFEHDGNGGVKKVKELRHPDDVFSRETMDSLKAIPYTTQSNHVSLMTPENVRERTYGTTLSNVERKDDHTAVSIKINDGKEIKAVHVQNNESLELSCGYDCDIVRESGEYNGERYDQRQTNIIYDHVARVEKARGGESCRIRLDSADSAICGIEAERLDNSGNQKPSQSGDKMTEKIKVTVIEKELPERVSGDSFRLDALAVTIGEDQKDLIKSIENREGKLFGEIQRLQTDSTKSQVKLDAQEKEINELKKQIENTIPAEKFDSEMGKRLKTWDLAKEYKVNDYQGMNIKDLNVTIAKESKMFNEDRMDDEQYVNFCIEHLQTEQAKNVSRSRQNLDRHQNQKFDMDDGDLNKPSRLEVS